IGRVVPGEPDSFIPDWSVVAVVSRGRDDGGRPLSVYRYFLCQGADSLWKILSWMEDYEQRVGHLPVFNPFESRLNPSEEISIPPEIPSEKLEHKFEHKSVPIVLSWEYQYNLRLINKIAEIKAGAEPVSWAYNAEALENPWSFVLIHPASERAYGSFLQLKANRPLALMPATVDEQALKSAIKSLINSSQVKSEAVLKIAGALGNEKITSDYWHRLFDGEGAQHALNHNLYTPQFVRLITLRAMVIPETLPEFLDWLNIKGGRHKPDNNQKISLEFQEAIGSQLPPDQLARGITLILPKLLARQITPEAVHWLLAARHSAWKHYRKQFINDVQADLEMISSFNRRSYSSESNSLRCGDKIWNKLINFLRLIRRRHRHYEPYYQPLSKLFEWLREYFLAAYFDQVCFGEVSKEIFNKAFPNSRKSVQYAFGLPIKPRMTPQEKISNQSSGILKFILETNIGIFGVIIIILLSLGYGVNYTYTTLLKKSTYQSSQSSYKMTKKQKNRALNDFHITSQSIQIIVQDMVKDDQLKTNLVENEKKILENQKNFPTKPKQPHKPEDQVAIVIKEILIVSHLQYADVKESDNTAVSNGLISRLVGVLEKVTGKTYCVLHSDQEKCNNLEKEKKEKWVEAIYEYQKKRKINPANGIIKNTGKSKKNISTYNSLKKETKQHLLNKLYNPNPK
ncbi:MAG: hypothetical protein F6K10_25280, partial [Moorea sp. SIO2B7]|nr:hypothetical protein [Moorena sp. SIO2B7]